MGFSFYWASFYYFKGHGMKKVKKKIIEKLKCKVGEFSVSLPPNTLKAIYESTGCVGDTEGYRDNSE